MLKSQPVKRLTFCIKKLVHKGLGKNIIIL